jgi:hypothetical protein
MPQFFRPTPEKHPMTRPAQPPDNIPGASGKMHPPEKHPRNEKLNAIKAQAELLLDVLMQEMDTNAAIIQILLLIIELIEAGEEPEDPG